MHSNGRDQSLYIDIYNVMVGIASVNATLLKQSMHSYRYWTYFQPDRHCFVSTPPSCPFNKEHKNMFHIHLDAIHKTNMERVLAPADVHSRCNYYVFRLILTFLQGAGWG